MGGGGARAVLLPYTMMSFPLSRFRLTVLVLYLPHLYATIPRFVILSATKDLFTRIAPHAFTPHTTSFCHPERSVGTLCRGYSSLTYTPQPHKPLACEQLVQNPLLANASTHPLSLRHWLCSEDRQYSDKGAPRV
jgi:hypothetical protein